MDRGGCVRGLIFVTQLCWNKEAWISRGWGWFRIPSIPSPWILTLNITPPPPWNFFGPRFGYKNVLDCKSFGNCSLYVATKCTNFSLHLFRSQRVNYTELSLSIKQIRSGFFDWSKEKQDFLNSDLFHFSPHYLTYFTMRHIFSEQRRLPGFRSILSVQFFFELGFIYLNFYRPYLTLNYKKYKG